MCVHLHSELTLVIYYFRQGNKTQTPFYASFLSNHFVCGVCFYIVDFSFRNVNFWEKPWIKLMMHSSSIMLGTAALIYMEMNCKCATIPLYLLWIPSRCRARAQEKKFVFSLRTYLLFLAHLNSNLCNYLLFLAQLNGDPIYLLSGENHNDNDDVREALDVILPGVNKVFEFSWRNLP